MGEVGAWPGPCSMLGRMGSFAPGTYLLSSVACANGVHDTTTKCTYQVHWTINPHMRPGAVDADVARAQHAGLAAVLRELGGRVEILPFVCGAFDSVFIKDNAVLTHDGRGGAPRALLGAPVHAVRGVEREARAAALTECGFDVAQLDHRLEGGDVIQLPGAVLLGCGPRSSPSAAHGLGKFLARPVYSLRLRDAQLYHLDTAMAVLTGGHALVCREAFDTEALAQLDELVARKLLTSIHAIPYQEARTFAANLVEVGRTVLTGTRAPHTRAILQRLHRTVIELPLDQFHLAGGSAACLVARVEDQRAMQIPTAAMRSAAA